MTPWTAKQKLCLLPDGIIIKPHLLICQWRNNIRKNEMTEPKQQQHPVVDVTSDGSKVQCYKEQYCSPPTRKSNQPPILAITVAPWMGPLPRARPCLPCCDFWNSWVSHNSVLTQHHDDVHKGGSKGARPGSDILCMTSLSSCKFHCSPDFRQRKTSSKIAVLRI